MLMDQPVIDYGSVKGGMGNSASDVREMDELAEAYERRRERGGNMAGRTVNLEEFVKGKA